MDIFGRRKRQRITELEFALRNVKSENVSLKEALDREKKMACGEKVPGAYCAGCKHGIAIAYNSYPFGSGITYECALMCKCKDFVKK